MSMLSYILVLEEGLPEVFSMLLPVTVAISSSCHLRRNSRRQLLTSAEAQDTGSAQATYYNGLQA